MAARKPTAATETRTEVKRAPDVVDGTLSAEEARAFSEAVAASEVDPRVWTGAFATNVWGGRFAVDGVLGEGSQGTTFSGTDLKTGAKVAIKVFDIGRAKDWKTAELFDREVETLKHVSHASIPQFLDVIVDEDTGARALVRTLIPGDSLAALLQRDGPMSEASLWHVLVDVADVLGALHSRPSPIVHRDLKPSNLIKRPDGKVCLVDFGGVGKMREAAGSTIVGTFGYMAPEQLYAAQTPATDIYALGASVLALATAHEPETLPRDGLAIDVDQAAPQLSPTLRALLKEMVAPDPKARPQDARALLGKLSAIAQAKDAATDAAKNAARDADHAAFLGDIAGAHENGSDWFVGIVTLVFSVLGVAGAVVVGQILLPLLLTVMHAFSSSPTQRAKLERARVRVRAAAKQARGTFEKSALEGATALEALAERERAHRQKHSRAFKQQKRAWKKQMREQAREQARQMRDEARRRRHEHFWR